MSKPRARRATACPMRPMPTSPSVLPATPVPARWLDCEPGNTPERTTLSPSTIRRATASINPKARSAVASVTTAGMLVTMILRVVASSTSMRSGVIVIEAIAFSDRIGGQHLAVDGVMQQAQDDIVALCGIDQLGFRQDAAGIVIDLDLGDLAQPYQRAFGDRLRDIDARTHDGPCIYAGLLARVGKAYSNRRARPRSRRNGETIVARKSKGKVGIIGLGIMGGAFARNLIADGWEVVGIDTDPARRKAMAKAGVAICDM